MDKLRDEQGEWISIKVRDSGVGISEEKLPYIFERFYQVDDSSTRKGEGTGIGLTLASEFAKLMKGELSVVSHPGKGSTFTLQLPFTTDAEPADSQEYTMPSAIIASLDTQTTIIDASENGNSSKPTVLIVEDNADVVHYLVLCLKDQYDVQIAMNGEEGIETAIETIPDLIVSDVMMPIKDGFELCETLKQEESTSHIPIILLTAKADVESRLAGLSRGADAYLAKPFHKPELLILIEQLIALRKKLRSRYRDLEPDQLLPSDDHDIQIEDAFVLKFHETVLADISNDQIDAVHLARTLGLSRSQLHRKLKALTGKTTMEIVKEIRLSKAKELLKSTDLTISEVGYEVGFKYPETFTRAFQDAFGKTPSEWKNV